MYDRTSLYNIFCITVQPLVLLFFFFNDTATTEIYTLSLHDALPIFYQKKKEIFVDRPRHYYSWYNNNNNNNNNNADRKSTRLNSSHTVISYAVFCLKKKKKRIQNQHELRVQMLLESHDLICVLHIQL